LESRVADLTLVLFFVRFSRNEQERAPLFQVVIIELTSMALRSYSPGMALGWKPRLESGELDFQPSGKAMPFDVGFSSGLSEGRR
jgi:hypothetical protein